MRVKEGYEVVVDHAGCRQIADRGDSNNPYVAINHDRGGARTACAKGYDIGYKRDDPARCFCTGATCSGSSTVGSRGDLPQSRRRAVD